jgi:hypothetical protein
MIHEHPPGLPPTHAADAPADEAARAIRVQLLATEHWSLLASRNLAWNESFARAGMFLTVLTGVVVALALVAQATGFSEVFVVFALLLLPIVLFVGLATFVRLNEINEEDLVWVQGMNRLRRAYLEIDPGLAEYFITGTTEDVTGVLRTYGARIGAVPSLRQNLSHALVTTPLMILAIDSVVAAVLVGLILSELGSSMQASALGAAVGFFGLFLFVSWWEGRKALAFWGSARRKPTEDPSD